MSSADGIERQALLSLCGRWRWWLSRTWSHAQPIGLVVMLNPSTADANVDDPTVTSLIKRATAWSWGGFYVVNLCAWRSPHPRDLVNVIDPIGTAENDRHIAERAMQAWRDGADVVAAWGNARFSRPKLRADLKGRDVRVLAQLQAKGPVFCIGRNANGTPTHPAARGDHRVPEDRPLEVYVTGPKE
jgi:hypothetical protein